LIGFAFLISSLFFFFSNVDAKDLIGPNIFRSHLVPVTNINNRTVFQLNLGRAWAKLSVRLSCR
jgi:hypothetical protein